MFISLFYSWRMAPWVNADGCPGTFAWFRLCFFVFRQTKSKKPPGLWFLQTPKECCLKFQAVYPPFAQRVSAKIMQNESTQGHLKRYIQ